MTSANPLNHEILNWLHSIPGVVAWRNNVGAMAIGNGASRRFVRYGATVGSGDILALLPRTVIPPYGRFVSIETKTENDRIRPSQIEWAKRIIDAGGIALTAYCLEDVISEIERAMNQTQTRKRKAA